MAVKKHWSHPDYGISPVDKLEYVLVRVNSLVDGKVKMINRTLSYSRYGSKEAALEAARDVRNGLLMRPEVIGYLNHTYAAPKRMDVMVRNHREAEREITVPGLNGVSIVEFGRTLKGHGRASSLCAVAICTKGNGEGFSRRQRSLNKHGAYKALRDVTNWRHDTLGIPRPTKEELMSAAEHVQETFGSRLEREADELVARTP